MRSSLNDEPWRLQTRLASMSGWIAATPGICNGGRALSRYHRHAFGGAVAVSRAHRGRGLGRYVNALMAAHACRHLDATHLYQFVSSDNLPSRRMVEAIGLQRDPTTIAAAITVSGTRFTR